MTQTHCGRRAERNWHVDCQAQYETKVRLLAEERASFGWLPTAIGEDAKVIRSADFGA